VRELARTDGGLSDTEILFPSEAAGYVDPETVVTRDITPQEDFSPGGAIARRIKDQKYEDTIAFNAEYADLYNSGQNSVPNAREQSALLRYRKISAINAIAAAVPSSLERFPTIAKAIVGSDMDEKDARNLINLMELDNAWTAITNNPNDETYARNIILSMPVVQRAAFFDFIPAKLAELAAEAGRERSPIENAWNQSFESINKVFNGLLWVSDKGQQFVASQLKGYSEGSLSPFGNVEEYWSQVSKDNYDQNYLNQLIGEYTDPNFDAKAVVDVILRWEELRRDGQPDPNGRFIAEYAGTPQQSIVRNLIYSDNPDPRVLELARLVNTANVGNVGMLALSVLPDELRKNQVYDVAAGAINLTSTLVLDPTIIGSKINAAFRASRYALVKLSTEVGVDAAFKYRRTKTFFDAFGRDAENLKSLDAGKRALARDLMARQYGNYITPKMMDSMIEAGVKDADTAKEWFKGGFETVEIIEGRAARTNPWFSEMMSNTQNARRRPLLPGKTVAGVMSNRVRQIISMHNPINNRFAKQLDEEFPSATGSTKAEGLDVASTLISGEGINAYTARVGVQPRLQSSLLEDSKAFGYRYSDRSISARLDRLGRRFAKAPLARTLSLVDGRDAKKVYDWARAFVPRYHATFIADAWRNAANEAERKLIYNGLMRSTAAVKGIQYVNKSGLGVLDRIVPELRRGATYSPTVLRRTGADGTEIIEGADTVGETVIRKEFQGVDKNTLGAENFDEALYGEYNVSDAASKAVIDRQLQDTITRMLGENPKLFRTTTTVTGKVVSKPIPVGKVTFEDMRNMRITREVEIEINLSDLRTTNRFVAGIDDTVSTRNSLFGNQDLPLHLWQTSDNVAMPSFAKYEEYGVKASIFGGLYGATNGKIAQGFVDFWSLSNLAGPRYFVRNTIEDFSMYAITEGRFMDLYRGRRFTTAFRESRPSYTRRSSNAEKLVSRLGVVNRLTRRKKKTVELTGNPSDNAVWSIIKDGFDEADKVAAAQAMRDGDLKKMRELVAIAMMRQRFTGITAKQADDLIDFVTENGAKIIDEIGEVSGFGVMGGVPSFGTLYDDGASLANDAANGVVNSRIMYPRGEFTTVELGGDNPLRFTYWHRNIIGTAEYDGIIGKIAIANLDKSDDEIIPLIAKAIREDTEFRYKERFAAFYQMNASPEDFARRYVSDVRAMFSSPDGKLNTSLWNRIAPLDGTTGERTVAALTREGGETSTVLRTQDLMDVPPNQRPTGVLGREVNEIPTATDMRAFDKIWSWMGEQYARVSREPLFFAHYLRERKILRPYEERLAEDFGPEFARKQAGKIATDRAYGMVLSYTDNPMNRTMLAYNTRNVARYYRATEDFARRFLRVAKNYPVGIWKAALVYDLLDDTGFVFKDENGQKYFVYPGSAIAMSLVAAASAKFFNVDTVDLGPSSYELRGKVTMLAPSFDVKSNIVTYSSPLSGIAVKSVMNAFPALRSLEQALIGEYGEGTDFWQTLFGGHITRALNLFSSDERESAYASVYKDAIQIAAAAGSMPPPTAMVDRVIQLEDGTFAAEVRSLDRDIFVALDAQGNVKGQLGSMPSSSIPEDQISPEMLDILVGNITSEYQGYNTKQDTDFRARMNVLVRSLMVVRFGGAFLLPASPQLTANNVSDYARERGILNIDSAFREIVRVESANDSQNPVGDALVKYVQTFGLDAVPFTISSTGSNDQFDSLNNLTTVVATREGAIWSQENKDLVDNHLTAASFLMPRVGEYDADQARWLIRAGLKIPKSIEEVYNKAKAIRGEVVYYGERDEAESSIADANNKYYAAMQTGNQTDIDAAWNEVKLRESAWTSRSNAIKAEYPALQDKSVTISNNARERMIENEIKPMLEYIFNKRGKPIDPTVYSMRAAVTIFDEYKTLINSISGTTNKDDESKRMLKIELSQQLDYIAGENSNIIFFVDQILKPIIDRKYDPPEIGISPFGGR